jgi:hypothetical protein
MENVLLCQICSENYDDDKRTPHILPSCGHTLCAFCIQNIFENEPFFRCPFDRKSLPEGRIFFLRKGKMDSESIRLTFPKNISIVQMLGDPKKTTSKDEEDAKNFLTSKTRFARKQSS